MKNLPSSTNLLGSQLNILVVMASALLIKGSVIVHLFLANTRSGSSTRLFFTLLRSMERMALADLTAAETGLLLGGCR
jgi:hypothetical protein